MTADRLRAAGAARLRAAGIGSAGAEAATLLAAILGVEPGRLLLIDDVPAAARAAYDDALARRERRIPLQHIVGRAHFYGLELRVGPGVFIPRPETELLAEWAITALRRADSGPARVADLCSGSGALALAIATAVPGATVLAVERSPDALAYLRGNVADQPEQVRRRVSVYDGDVTDVAAMAALLGGCDLVVCNPPYVPVGGEVSPEVAHDPPEAVFSGDSGMDLITALVPVLRAGLVPGGRVGIEHDDTTSAAVANVLSGGGFTEITAHSDLAGRPRFVTARR